MAFKVSRKKNISPMRIIGKLAGLAIALWVGQILLAAVQSSIGQTTIDNSSGFFYQAYKFMGLCSAPNNAGIIVIVGVVAVAALALEFVDIKF